MTEFSEGPAIIQEAASIRDAAAAPPAKREASNSILAAYASGSIAFAVIAGGLTSWLLLYYNQIMGLSSALAGLALAIALWVDAFVDPIIGYTSDNLRSRLGRRHPFMYAAIIPLTVAFIFLWNPPHLSQWNLFIYLLVTLVVVRSLVSCFEIPAGALLPELTSDYDHRTVFISLRQFLGSFATTAMSVLTLRVFLVPTPKEPVGQLNAGGYHLYALVAAAVMFTFMVVCAVGTHRAIPNLSRPPRSGSNLLQALRVIGTTLGDRSAAVLFICGILWAIAAGTIGSLGYYLDTYFWELTTNQISLLALAIFAGTFVGLLLAPRFSRWFGKRYGGMLGAIGWFTLGPAPIFLRLLGWFPHPGSPLLVPLLILFLILTHGLGSASAMLVGSMMADVVEATAIKTGRRSEGVLGAASSFIAKAFGGTGVAATGFLIALVHFPAKARPHHVPAPILQSLALTSGTVWFSFYFVAMLFLAAYNINRAKHAANLAQLAEVRAAE